MVLIMNVFSPDGAARFLSCHYAEAGIRTQVNKVAPSRDLLTGALPSTD